MTLSAKHISSLIYFHRQVTENLKLLHPLLRFPRQNKLFVFHAEERKGLIYLINKIILTQCTQSISVSSPAGAGQAVPLWCPVPETASWYMTHPKFYSLKIFSIALPLASSSTSLSRYLIF